MEISKNNIREDITELPIENLNGKYHINHQETKNDELGVTLTQSLSCVLDIPISEINLEKYFDMDGLNNIFENFDKNSPNNSKITFRIKNTRVEIYNNKDIIIKPNKHI